MSVQITNERMEAYVEVIEVLKYMDKKYVEKIPKKLREFFVDNCSKDYNFKINPNIPLSEQNLKNITLAILGMLNVNYWCEDEKHKQELLTTYYESEQRYQEILEELKEKYNSDDIFKDSQVTSITTAENMQMIEYKKTTWHKKIFKKILNFFNKANLG